MSALDRCPAGVLALTVVLLAGGALAQPQSPAQQRCITALNAGFAKVAKTRGKAQLRCAKAATRGESAADCVADSAARLDKALDKLDAARTKKCAAAPDFGPDDAGAMGEAAVGLADAALSDLLGLSLDAAMADKKQAKDTARCQLGVAKAAQRCALARVQGFNRCKKAGLKDGSIASADDLATCLDDDAGGRLARACTAKLEKAAARCTGVDLPAAFPACGASDAAGLTACADARLACRARDALAAADGMDMPGCGSITPELETGLAATADIGPEGGEVLVVGGDGTVYRLSVPAGALLSETAITITPVSAIPDLPLTGGLLAAVELAPDGLQLWEGATLTIELPSAPPSELAGFGWSGAGENVHLALLGVDGSTLTLAVTHFSGAGAAITAPENLAALLALPPGSVEQQFLNQLPATDEVDPLVWVAWLSAWFDAGVEPLLAGATTSEEALLGGMSEFVSWKTMAEETVPFALGFEFDFFLGLDGFALANRVDEGLALAATALREGVIRNDDDCLAAGDLAFAEAELRWQQIAGSLGLATEANGLDLGTVLGDFCVEVVYESIAYPEFPQAGATSQLVVSAGYSIAGGPAQFDLPLSSPVLATGTVEGFNEMIIPAGSNGELGYTPTGDEELVISLNACLYTPDDHPVLDGKVCQPAILVRGFQLTPEDATLAPGEEQDFDVLLYGEPHPSVTWTATGGEITQDGVYTAGDEPGSYTVTATSNLSGLTETASVTVGEGTEPSLTFEPVAFGGQAVAGNTGCELPVPDLTRDTAGIADYPSFALSASQGNGFGEVALAVDVNETTGVVTITASAVTSASSGPCPPEAFFPNTSAQGNGSLDFQFDFDPGETPYTFETTGSISGGGGDFDAQFRLFETSVPSVSLAACSIHESGISVDQSCPGGATISDTGPLPAGRWRLNAFAPSQAGAAAASNSGFDLTLTLTPQ